VGIKSPSILFPAFSRLYGASWLVADDGFLQPVAAAEKGFVSPR
jgi:hypothetical protein